eukprot:Rhum_TRINITY_DN13526_c0_g1::Rhum_TRINITY_DN13526_c0_g1_i1::g.60999::m.60999
MSTVTVDTKFACSPAAASPRASERGEGRAAAASPRASERGGDNKADDLLSAASEDERELHRRIVAEHDSTDAPTEVDRMAREIHRLQAQLIERDTVIHDLHHKAHVSQEDENRKTSIKRGFSVIEKRYVNTDSTDSVMQDSMHHLIYTMVDTFGGCAGILILDVPYNACIGASNKDLKKHLLLRSFWEETPSIPHCVLRELEDMQYFRDVATQKKGKVLNEWETGVVKQGARGLRGAHVQRVMVVPIVVDGGSIALAVMVNGAYTQRDPLLLAEVLSELWTSNVLPLINIALDTERKAETEARLVTESLQRDEIILTLDTILEEVVTATVAAAASRVSSETLWKAILQRVADYFEEYYGADVLVAVTNTEANFRIHRSSATGSGGSSRGGGGASKRDSDAGLEFIYYIFSQSLEHVRRTSMKHLNHPRLQDSKVMGQVVSSGQSLFSSNCKEMTWPCGHMKMNSLLLVPVMFCEEPVGMLGLANGDFCASTGRILQSVFNTFWSMIVKATVSANTQNTAISGVPLAIADRLKNGEVVADAYESATVLFANIVSFSAFTKNLTPKEVVEFTNLVFRRLDEAATELNLEKIKVIGDSYMLVGGLKDKSGRPTPGNSGLGHVEKTVEFGVRVLEIAEELNNGGAACSEKIREQLEKMPLQFRVGISEGPLTAGVFGAGKLQYDVLGPCVNTAARLEASGRPGCVQINQSVYDVVKDEYTFEKRKPICLKGIGLQQTYYITGDPQKPFGRNHSLTTFVAPVLPSPVGH